MKSWSVKHVKTDWHKGLNSEIDSCTKVAYHIKIVANCKMPIQNYVQNDIGIDLIDLSLVIWLNGLLFTTQRILVLLKWLEYPEHMACQWT